MADTSKQVKKIAPSVQAVLAQTDERTRLVDEYKLKDPKYVYKFHRRDVSDNELERTGYEKVVKDGCDVNHNGDPLIRREAGLDLAVRRARQKASYNQVKDKLHKADKAGKLRQTRKPKSPTNNDEY